MARMAETEEESVIARLNFLQLLPHVDHIPVTVRDRGKCVRCLD